MFVSYALMLSRTPKPRPRLSYTLVMFINNPGVHNYRSIRIVPPRRRSYHSRRPRYRSYPNLGVLPIVPPRSTIPDRNTSINHRRLFHSQRPPSTVPLRHRSYHSRRRSLPVVPQPSSTPDRSLTIDHSSIASSKRYRVYTIRCRTLTIYHTLCHLCIK